MNRPHRACVLTLTLEADDRRAMASALVNLAHSIEREETNGPHGVSGSPDAGYTYGLTVSDQPTHEQYHASLIAYIDALNNERPTP